MCCDTVTVSDIVSRRVGQLAPEPELPPPPPYPALHVHVCVCVLPRPV